MPVVPCAGVLEPQSERSVLLRTNVALYVEHAPGGRTLRRLSAPFSRGAEAWEHGRCLRGGPLTDDGRRREGVAQWHIEQLAPSTHFPS